MIELLNSLPSFIYGIQLLCAQLLLITVLPKRKNWGWYYAAQLLVFFSTSLFMPDLVLFGLFYMPSFPLIGFLIVANALILKLKRTEALFVTICIAIMQHFAECLTMAIRYLFPLTSASVWWFAISFICYIISYGLFFLLFQSYKEDLNMESGKLIGIFFAVFFIIYTLRNVAVTLCDMYEENGFVRATINGYAAVCCFFCIFFMFTSNKADDLTMEKEVMTNLLHQEQAHYAKLVAQQDIINRKCHDLKYEIAAMRKMPVETQQELIDKLEQDVMIYEHFAKTGNASLDYTLSEKSLQCLELNIKFSYIVDGAALSFMEETDIYTLFGNAIDNAIECVTRYEEEKRIISLKVIRMGNMLRLHFENYCEEVYDFKEELIPTLKEKKDYHGFGLKSIRYIAEKYKGFMDISCENNLFLLDILIPIADE